MLAIVEYTIGIRKQILVPCKKQDSDETIKNKACKLIFQISNINLQKNYLFVTKRITTY